MKKATSLLFGFAALTLLAAGCVGPKYMVEVPNAAAPTPPADKALVTFVRPAGYARGARFIIIDDQLRFLGETLGKTQFTVALEPGNHVFVGASENTSGLQADLAAGKHYYVHVQPTMGAFTAQVQLKAIKPGTDKWEDLDKWLAKSKVLQPKGNKGQQYVDSKRESYEKRIDTANEKLDGYEGDTLEDRTLRPEDAR